MFFFYTLTLLIIFFQDLRARKVSLILFMIIAIIGNITYVNKSTSSNILFYNISLNIGFIAIIVLILYLYSIFFLKKNMRDSIGLGDILFFLTLAISYPTVTFLTLFSSSLIFSLILFLFLKPYLKNKTVPLAGLQALFLGIILIINKSFSIVNLYIM